MLAAATGLLLLALRATGAMGIVLAIHLGIILALFAVLPYSKFVHGIYRSAALLAPRHGKINAGPTGGTRHEPRRTVRRLQGPA